MTVRSIRVAAQVNNCNAYYTGTAWAVTTTTAVAIGYQGASYYKRGCGLRFLNVLIPKGATINTSYITFTCQYATADTVINSYLTGELTGTPAAFSTIANYQARRGTACGGGDDTQRTVAQVPWDGIGAWVLDTTYNSPSLNTPLQEMVNTNALKDCVFFWDDHDARGDQVSSHWKLAYSYNGSSTKCPLLYVDFTPPYKVWPGIDLSKLPLGIR